MADDERTVGRAGARADERTDVSTDARTEELAGALTAVRDRIARAAAAAGRKADEVTLIAVTKFFPVADAHRLLELGVRDLGESRDQEAAPKAAELPSARWHFVGRLQTNKARSVATYADVVHSLDRPALADALAAGVRRAGRATLPVLAQVNLDEAIETDPDGASARGGWPVDDVDAFAERIAEHDELTLAGLMAIAPLGADPDTAFARLQAAADRLRKHHPSATAISAGMSDDLEAAVAHGATHVRIGTALLGRRPANVG